MAEIFPGAPLAVMAMAGTMDAGKLVLALLPQLAGLVLMLAVAVGARSR